MLYRVRVTPTHLNLTTGVPQVSVSAASEADSGATRSTTVPDPSNPSKPAGGGFLRGLTTRKPKATSSAGQPGTRLASAAPLPPASLPSQSALNRGAAAESLATAELPTAAATATAFDGPPVPPLPVRRLHHITIPSPRGCATLYVMTLFRKGTHWCGDDQ